MYATLVSEALNTEINALEKSFASIENGNHGLAFGSGLAAIDAVIKLLKPGDEVITPSFNNVADFQAILAVGALPVLCDIREDTLCIDAMKVEELIGPKTKAIIVMDYGCCLADYDDISDLAAKYNLRVIHDAAHSIGSYYKGKKVGMFSDICMFSFDPVKTITCIDGGALVVKTQEEVDLLHQMRLVGMGQSAGEMYKNQRAWTYDVSCLGFRYHMANLHAAIGLAQLEKINDITDSRQASCILYNELLEGVKQVRTPKSDFMDVTPFHYYIRVNPEYRHSLREFLKNNSIDTGVHWQPGHWFALLSDVRKGDLNVTDMVGEQILSLPLHSNMESATIMKIVKAIEIFFSVPRVKREK